MRSRITTTFAVVVAVTCLAAASCSSDDKDDKETTTTTEAASDSSGGESAETVRWTEEVQQELKDVGCYTGADDGIVGPETDAAIKDFQTAEGLEVDGEVGPETQAALTKAASEGKTVCGGSSNNTTTTQKSSTTTTAASGGSAACTATALMGGLPAEGEKIATFTCSGGYAAGTLTDGTKFILQSENGQWYAPSQDPCGSASAGIPPVILEDGCPAS